MTNLIKNESKLGKIVKNLDVLVPFKMAFISEESEKSITKRITNGIFSLALTMVYLPLSVVLENANPLKWPEIYKQDMLEKQQVRVEYSGQVEAFHSKLYKELAGEDRIIDLQEFKNFCKRKEIEDEPKETYYYKCKHNKK